MGGILALLHNPGKPAMNDKLFEKAPSKQPVCRIEITFILGSEKSKLVMYPNSILLNTWISKGTVSNPVMACLLMWAMCVVQLKVSSGTKISKCYNINLSLWIMF